MKFKGVAVATGVNLLLLASMSPGFADEDGPNVSYTTSSGYTVEKGQTSSESSGDSYDGGTSVQSQESEVLQPSRQSSSAARVEDEAPPSAQQDVILPPLTTGDIGGDVDIRTVNRRVANVITRSRDVASRNANVVDNDVLSENNIDLLSDNVIILDALNQDNDSFHCINTSCNHIDDHSIRDSFNIERSFNGNIGSFNRGITTFDLDRDRRARRIDLVRDARGEGRALPKTGLFGHAMALLTVAIFSIVLGMSFQYAGWRRISGLQPYLDALRSVAGIAPPRDPELLPLDGPEGNLAGWPFHVRQQFVSVLSATAAFSAHLEERAGALVRALAARLAPVAASVKRITVPRLGRGPAAPRSGWAYDGGGVRIAGLWVVKRRVRIVKRLVRRRLAACAEFCGYCVWVVGRLSRQVARNIRSGQSSTRSTGRHTAGRTVGARRAVGGRAVGAGRAVVLRSAVLVGSLMLAFISFAG